MLVTALSASGCATTIPPAPPPVDYPKMLLALVGQVIESSSPEQRRGIEEAERTRFEAAPTYDNLMRLTLVRAFSAALPAELMKTRADLQTLAEDAPELSDEQRQLAMMALIMVDQRLQMGAQIADLQKQRLQMGAQIDDLQKQIDSLTEIEASLNDNSAIRPEEESP